MSKRLSGILLAAGLLGLAALMFLQTFKVPDSGARPGISPGSFAAKPAIRLWRGSCLPAPDLRKSQYPRR